MNHEFKVGDQFDLVESLGIAYSHDQSIAPKGKQFIAKRDGHIVVSVVAMGKHCHETLAFWMSDASKYMTNQVKPIGSFTITSLKNKHN